MNYPIWQLNFAGGGLLIATIAIIHVYVAHFAVGGGLFLVLTELKGLRERNQGILDYARKNTLFFLLITMVFSSVTGVGIWFTISLLNPAATSVLIHTFVFAWATEWTFFVIEIISLLIYYYMWGKMDDRDHLMIGWVYFGAAWMSLFVINGIIDFMLTPGSWIETNNFWGGFFNPTFWPALFFRTFLAIIIAGLFGFITSSCIKDDELRTTMVRYCAKWLLVPFILLIASAWWYRAALPPHVEAVIFQKMPALRPFITIFTVSSALVVIGGLVMAIRMPSGVSKRMAAAMLIIGLFYIGGFEFIREGGRKPFIIKDYMYSTSILKKDMAKVAQQGVMQNAKWVEHREINDHNLAAAGREVFNLLCSSCHSVGGPLHDIKELTARSSPDEMDLIISTMGTQRPYMPPFIGTEKEKKALYHFLFTTLHGVPVVAAH